MRPIKFKAWHKEERIMCDVDVLTPKGAFLIGIKKADDIYYNDGKDIIRAPDNGRFCYNDEFELVQFTGLPDMNGKEIYEDDIIEIDGGNDKVRGQVIFEDGCFCFKAPWVNPGNSYPELKYYTVFSSLPDDAIFKDCVKVSIIGNIYESPELLKPNN